MTEWLKVTIIAQLAIAILILPSAALPACNCSAEDPDWGNFSSQCEARISYEYCKSLGNADSYDLDGYNKKGTVGENRPGPCFPPVAYDGTVTINENTAVEITLYVTDPDGDTITYRIVNDPLNGTLGTITGTTVLYIPYENYTGVDSFSFSAHDGTWDSNTATVTLIVEPEGSPILSHAFYGNVTIDGEPAPEFTMIVAVGPGVCSNITGNPVTVHTDGSYGSAGLTSQNLVVQGCIEDGAPVTFFADGIQAEVCDVTTSGPWQSAHPFRAGEVTNLDIRIPQTIPTPDKVYISAIGVTISNSTYGFSSMIKLEKDPWMELKVTRDMFDIQISATGFHVFGDQPVQGRDATFGIYENGIPVSSERTVWFGSRTARYEYVATETRTFDILIYVNGQPEIYDVKHLTIQVIPGSE